VWGVMAALALLTSLAGWLWWRVDGLRKEPLTRQLAADSGALLTTSAGSYLPVALSADSYVPAALLAVESMKRGPPLENYAALWQSAGLMARQVSSLVHQGKVNAVAFSPHSEWVATGSDDGTARVMEAATGKEVSRNGNRER
jgi:WD40 repeat protein